ncbi:zf-C3HC-domain-containing protein [Xylariaceae sp. FL1272]|nr:zf-C3HC-domain-containing protein [Xylariaceae sp. FL1272]
MAMNATKRKFNSLIQGIGGNQSPSQPNDKDHVLDTLSSPLSRPSPSLPAPQLDMPLPTASSSSPTAALLAKRRRIAALESSSSPTTKTTISNIILKKWDPRPATSRNDSSHAASPSYCPSDRDELIRRLRSFQELTEWTPKPDIVNEIEWAKRGWLCYGKERVRCSLCHKELVVRTGTRTVEGKEVPVVAGSDVEQALAKRFAELITEAHATDCLWKRHGCDDSLLRLPLTVAQTALTSLRRRYDDLCTRQSFLPYLFNLRLPATLDIHLVKFQLPPAFFTDPPPPATNPASPNDVALLLAMTGWQGLTNDRIGAVPNTATCGTCLRRLGLWMFKSKEVDEATGQILVPAPMDSLDPVREHRFFCPWRSATAQHNPGAKTKSNKAAWEVLAQTLKNSAYLRQQAEKSNPRSVFHRPTASLPGTPATPSRIRGHGNDQKPPVLSPQAAGDEEEDMAASDAKDKERWAKLRRVKSLFDTKGRKKLQRTLSRPGTAASRPPTSHSRKDSAAADTEAES